MTKVSPIKKTLPVTLNRFGDLETLFTGKGCSFARGCWCMGYRETRHPKATPGASVPEQRKAALRALCGQTPAPGLIGYDASNKPLGWVAAGPRETFPRLQRSPVMRPVDDQPTWAVVCFVVPTPHRGQGIAGALLRSAIAYAAAHHASMIEGFPIDKPNRSQDQWLWHGARIMFDQAGFQEVARRKPERPVMRLCLNGKRGAR